MIVDEVNTQVAAGKDIPEERLRLLNKVMGHRDDAYVTAMQQNYDQETPADLTAGKPGAPVNISSQMPTRADQARQGRY